MLCGEIYTIPTVHGKLFTYPLSPVTLRMFPSVWLVNHFNRSPPDSWLPSGNQHPKIERRRYRTHCWQCCWRETYNPSSKRSSNRNWYSWPSLQSWENLFGWGKYLLLTDFSPLSFFLVARYWKDPHSFKPARFLEDWPRDAFIPFSAGEYFVFSTSVTLLTV